MGSTLDSLKSFVAGTAAKAQAGRRLKASAAALLICCVLCLHAGAQEAGQPANNAGPTPTGRHPDRKPSIPDAEVFNQDGKKIRFYSDLIKDKVVIVSFVFTTCTFVCPMQGESLSKLQAALGERLGSEVHLVTVSTDPEGDTPERLKIWGSRFGSRPGWTLVTGKKSEIDKVSVALTGAPAVKGEHSPVVFVGSDKTGKWVRAYGLGEPAKYAGLIDEVTAARVAPQQAEAK
jgi:cytochrome oxidase Cu insertion factor (SCO1/SenC/PrrC family)